MAKHTVIAMPGDGIGNQVLPEALRVLNAVGFDGEYIHVDIGWECWRNEGNALPDRTIDLLAKHKQNLSPSCAAKATFITARSLPCGRNLIWISACGHAWPSRAIP